ncbi:MAG: lysoplasmalogenase family protein [Candidatus Odinarchaeota archaeon]
MKRIPPWFFLFLKGVPAALASLFAFTSRTGGDRLFQLAITIGLLACLAGDVGIDLSFIAGMGFFSIAQLVFIVTYAGHALGMTLKPESLIITLTVIIIMVIYVVFILKFLQGSEKGLGSLKIPVTVYSSLLALHFCAAILLWLTAAIIEGIVIVMGAFVFVVSDTTLAVREFHHRPENSVIKVMATYYLALLFISLSILVF